MRAGHKRAPRSERNVRQRFTAPAESMEAFEACASRRGITLSAWLLDAARQLSIAEGGDPDVGAP